MLGPSRLMVHFLRLLEDSHGDHFGLIVADADRSLISPEGRLSEGPAWGSSQVNRMPSKTDGAFSEMSR